MRFLIIGGSDAGISAALRLRELDRSADVAVLLADEYPNWSVCGLPYFLSGETPDWHDLAHRTEFRGIKTYRRHVATSIDPAARAVTAQGPDGERRFFYDRLLIATGAPLRPNIPGLEHPRLHLLHTMGDALAVDFFLRTDPRPQTALIVGAGYIGLEMAEALAYRGLRVTVVSRSDPVFPTVEPAFGRAIGDELRRNKVVTIEGCTVEALEDADPSAPISVRGSNGFVTEAHLVLVAVGLAPNTVVASTAGVSRGAIAVDRHMRTNVPDILAAGDCVETWHRMLAKPMYLPLGTTSHKQGRIAAENMLGGDRLFAGSVGTQVVKLFDLAVGRTGLLEREARDACFDPLTVETTTWDHKAYYPGAKHMRLRVTADRSTGRLLGAQILGAWGSEVAKRVDVFAAALFHGMTVDQVSDLDLSYAPPFSSPRDPLQQAAQAWSASRASIADGLQGLTNEARSAGLRLP
jgi:NADPH-dependent 2,4-dienoyl-CoA reductase/sulfur reductase-like enzyme